MDRGRVSRCVYPKTGTRRSKLSLGPFGKQNKNEQADLDAQVRQMRLYFAAWLRQRLQHLTQGEGFEAPAAAPSDLAGDDKGASVPYAQPTAAPPNDPSGSRGADDDIFGNM